MNRSDHPQIHEYLETLERHLSPLKTLERAEILIEIKSHITDALHHDENAAIKDVLQSLGSPKDVAKRYLMEKGLSLQTIQETHRRQEKALTSGTWKFIGILILNGIVTGHLIVLPLLLPGHGAYFFPKSTVFSILACVLISLGSGVYIWKHWFAADDDSLYTFSNSFSFGGSSSRDKGSEQIAGLEEVEISFKQGKLEIQDSGTPDLITWDCKSSLENPVFHADPTSHRAELNFSAGKCVISVPAKVLLTIGGGSGKVTMKDLANPIELSLGTGKIEWSPRANTDYKYELSAGLVNKDIKEFVSSNSPDALPVTINLGVGKLTEK